MKRVLIVLISLFMITGCGGSDIQELDIAKASNTIEESLKDMEVVSEESLKDIYAVDTSLFTSFVIKQNMEGEMYAIILTSNKTMSKENMEAYFNKVRDYNVAYSPEQVKLIDNRLEKEIGNYLIYIVSEDSDKIYQDIIDNM
ncbi:MAG: DUF4358 domain-containing protein [Firmicutes bacterium]|nr:DUF4358 domain-containing protein [Bacillota bacterium]